MNPAIIKQLMCVRARMVFFDGLAAPRRAQLPICSSGDNKITYKDIKIAKNKNTKLNKSKGISY